MKEIFRKFIDGEKNNIVTAVLFLLAAFLAVQTLTGLAELRFVGSGIPAVNTISVEGVGEAVAVPDIATISFTIRFKEDTVAQAQEKTTVLVSSTLAYLDDQDIADKDIKTNSYNVYPQYNYFQTTCIPGVPCRGGESKLSGYEVSQSISVKIRDLDQVGAILGGLGEMNVQNINGPNFEIDDLEKIQADAREEAIKEAKSKAKVLARDLGVKLVRVVGFWEDNGYYGGYKAQGAFDAVYAEGSDFLPEIPVGENEITTRVNITYEIR